MWWAISSIPYWMFVLTSMFGGYMGAIIALADVPKTEFGSWSNVYLFTIGIAWCGAIIGSILGVTALLLWPLSILAIFIATVKHFSETWQLQRIDR